MPSSLKSGLQGSNRHTTTRDSNLEQWLLVPKSIQESMSASPCLIDRGILCSN